MAVCDTPDRRQYDVAVAVLQVQQKDLADKVERNGTLLEQHVTGCAKLQKWVLGVLIFLAGWTVASSPKAAQLFFAVLGSL